MIDNIDIEKMDKYYINKYDLINNGDKLEFIPYMFRSLTLCFISISNYPEALEFVPKKLITKEFEYIPFISISQDPCSIKYLVRDNISYITYNEAKVAVNLNGNALGYLDHSKYIKSKEIIMDAISNYPDAIKYVDYNDMDKDIMMCAVKGSGMSLRYLVNYIKQYNEKTGELVFVDVIEAAIKQNPQSYTYIKDILY